MRLPREHRTVKGVSLTPLIDVVFLLLIFFMLASTFLRFGHLPISSGAPGASSPLAQVIRMHLREGQIALNGKPVAREALTAHLNALAAQGAKKAVIEVGTGVSVQELIAVLERAKRSKLKSITVTR